MKTRLFLFGNMLALLSLGAAAANAQTASGTIRSFEEHCATCHRNPGVARAAGAEQAPDTDALRRRWPTPMTSSNAGTPSLSAAGRSDAFPQAIRKRCRTSAAPT